MAVDQGDNCNADDHVFQQSGTTENNGYLCSPETATASAITGVITDPRALDLPPAELLGETGPVLNPDMFQPPPAAGAAKEDVEKGPNFRALPNSLELPAAPDQSFLLLRAARAVA